MKLDDRADMREAEQIPSGRVPMSARLEAIVELAECGDTVCDVGCDHAHVPIRLIQTGCYRRAIGMDVIDGPLGKAAGNLALYQMEDRVELRLSDGLDAFVPGEADTLVITGMGGTLMEEILLRDPEKTGAISVLVLGPQSDPEKVRAALRRLGFAITREKLIFEDGKYYPVIRAESAVNTGFSTGKTDGAHVNCRIQEKDHIPGRAEADEQDHIPEQTEEDEQDHIPGQTEADEQDHIPGQAEADEQIDFRLHASFSPQISEEIRQEAEDRFGPVLLGRRDPVLLEFLTRRTAVMEKILRSVRDAAQKSSDDPVLLQRHSAKIREIEHSLTVYHAALTAYDKPWRKS